MSFASASFTGTVFQELSAADANWVKQTGYTTDALIGSTGSYLICNNDTNLAVYRHTATPPSPDYSVAADFAKLSGVTDDVVMAVIGRASSTSDTYYFAQYNHATTQLRLFRRNDGTSTQMGSAFSVTRTSTPVRVALVMDGSSISVTVDGVMRIGPVTDTSITAAGFAGVRGLGMRQVGVADAGSIDNFNASVPSSGYSIAAEGGSYTLTGVSADLKTTRRVVAEAGAYTYTGNDATLTYTQPGVYTLVAEGGSYVITGVDAFRDLSFNAEGGSYTTTGYNVSFSLTEPMNYTIIAEGGSYNITGRTVYLLGPGDTIPTTKSSKLAINIGLRL